MSGLVYLRNVSTIHVDALKCNGCGICLKVCPHPVLAREGKLVRVVDRDACMECGACSRNCPEDAVFVEAGVGCAAAVINYALGRTDAPCCGPSESGGPGCC